MALDGVSNLANLIPEVWSSKMYDELRASNSVFMDIFTREYEGDIKGMGDIVRVNQVAAPTGEVLTDDTASFSSEAITINQKTVTVNKRASAAFEISDLAQLQSMPFQAQIREGLVYSIRKQIESAIISALDSGVSTVTPDHDIAPASASDLASADLASMRTLLSQQSVPTTQRHFVCDPAYFGDLLGKTAITSLDFVGGRNAEEGNLAKYMGFMVNEHDLLAADKGYAVHPSALALVIQQGVRVKISDLHVNKQYGYMISADMVFGLSVFDNKRYVRITA